MRKAFVLLAALAALVLAGSGGASGSTLFVDDDGADCPSAYLTIQAGVTAAGPGDTVKVCKGTYAGGVLVNKAGLRLKAEGPLGAVKIAGTGTGVPLFGIDVVADDVEIEGFEIYGFSGAQDASGIFVGGLFAGDTAHPADGSEIKHNSIHGNGNGVYLWQSNDNKVKDNDVFANKDFTGSEGTGILSFNGFGDVQVVAANAAGRSGLRNEISHNEVYGNDRLGIFAGACTEAAYGCVGPTGVHADITGTKIEHNDVYGNGVLLTTEAVGLLDASGGTIAHNKVHDNHLLGVYVNYSDGATVDENKVKDNPYYGLLVNGSSSVRVSDNDVTGSKYHGIYVLSSSAVTVEKNDANGNSTSLPIYSGIRVSGSAGIAVTKNETDGNGRGIYATGTTGSVFSKNSAKNNSVFDLDRDGTVGNAFSKNKCGTANPSKAAWDCK